MNRFFRKMKSTERAVYVGETEKEQRQLIIFYFLFFFKKEEERNDVGGLNEFLN